MRQKKKVPFTSDEALDEQPSELAPVPGERGSASAAAQPSTPAGNARNDDPSDDSRHEEDDSFKQHIHE